MTEPTAATQRFTARHAMALAGAGLLVAAAMLFFMSGSILLPPLAADLGVGLGQVMLFVTITFAVSAVVMSVGGPFFDRFGARRLVIVGGVFSAAMFLGVSFVNGLGMLYAFAALAGALFLASTQMAATMIVNAWFHANRGTAMGVMQALGGLGGIAAGSLLPVVVQTGGWQLGFRTAAGIVAAIAVVAGLLVRSRPADAGLHPYGLETMPTDDVEEVVREDVVEEAHDAGMEPADALRSPRFAALVLGILLINLVNAIQQHFAPLMEGNGLDLTAAGSLISILAIGNVVATLLLGTLIDRWGALQTALLSMALMIGAMLAFWLTTGYGGQLAGILLFAVPSVLSPVVAPLIVRQVFGERAFNTLIGIGIAAMPLGVAIGSPLWGVLYDMTGGYTVQLIGSIVAALLACVLFAFTLSGHQGSAGHARG